MPDGASAVAATGILSGFPGAIAQGEVGEVGGQTEPLGRALGAVSLICAAHWLLGDEEQGGVLDRGRLWAASKQWEARRQNGLSPPRWGWLDAPAPLGGLCTSRLSVIICKNGSMGKHLPRSRLLLLLGAAGEKGMVRGSTNKVNQVRDSNLGVWMHFDTLVMPWMRRWRPARSAQMLACPQRGSIKRSRAIALLICFGPRISSGDGADMRKLWRQILSAGPGR
ncbi:hypothetical protein EDB81DRAFT_254747 [Dactylonectria macrodidyma]|uniref:Uncharacterized protein n=1 Tax=Dactylonectria macrodidyma TaxID=307937 RepID=A0A9P9FKM6_9HYPO|nr:hypothetical protein EDB81DRAFT_254747 [Dactylonectria macrodidyma]